MSAFIVTYDLHDASKETALLEYLRAYSYAKVANSSYVILSQKTPDQIRDDITAITDKKITVYVFTVVRPYSGFGGTDVNDWLAKWMP